MVQPHPNFEQPHRTSAPNEHVNNKRNSDGTSSVSIDSMKDHPVSPVSAEAEAFAAAVADDDGGVDASRNFDETHLKSSNNNFDTYRDDTNSEGGGDAAATSTSILNTTQEVDGATLSNNNSHDYDESEEVSDISATESEPSDGVIDDDWVAGGDDRNFSTQPTRRSFTICSVITNPSDHGSIRSQRENVDRLLMSAGGNPDGMESDGSGYMRPRSNSRGCMQMNVSPSFAYTYNQNYYKSADWLRFVPRRSSKNDHSSASSDQLPSLDTNSAGNSGSQYYYVATAGVTAAAAGHQSHHHITPDQYYRGFDNTRVGFYPLRGGTTVKRREHPSESYHSRNGQHSVMTPMYPSMMNVAIDEEAGGGDDRRQSTSDVDALPDLPREIHCDQSNRADAGVEVIQDHDQGATEVNTNTTTETMDQRSISQPPPEQAAIQFESSLRVGGIIRPVSPHYLNNHNPHDTNVPENIREQQMHMASWDSKYETYACRVDQSQEDRSVEIPLFSMARPHMRAFHFAWLTFFFVFLAWFSITPLLSEVQKSLDLTKEQLWTSSIFSVAGGLVTRCLAGPFCDIYGARLISAAILFICGIPTMFTGLVNSSVGLSVLRLIVGIGGSAFVTCQYWTSTTFTMEVAGTANALAAGWGNLGGGVAQILVGTILFPLFKLIYKSAGTAMDPAELSWRTCCIIPGLICSCFTFIVLRHSDDSPKGNYRKRKRLGLMQKDSAMHHIKAAVCDHNTWLLLIQYGCCFGVELTTTNAAALYFKEEFELSTESAAAIASTFGWMNLFARGLGGFLSDVSNAYRGMRGRLVWQFVCFALEGAFICAFSKANSLAGAIIALMTFSLFVQGAEGSTFGIVPYLNPNLTGTVAGIVGAGGSAGAVVFSIMFRQMDYRIAFFYMGVATTCSSVLSIFIWIVGYEGLFFKRRMPQLRAKQENTKTSPQTDASLSHEIELPSERLGR